MTDGSLPGAHSPRPHGRLTRWFVGITAALSLLIAATSAYGYVAYKLSREQGGRP